MASMLLITLFKKFYFSEFFVFSFKFILITILGPFMFAVMLRLFDWSMNKLPS